MSKTERELPKFNAFDFALRLIAAWLGAWVPIAVFTETGNVHMPKLLILIMAMLAAVVIYPGYVSARLQRVICLVLAGGTALACLVAWDSVKAGYRAYHDVLTSAINYYYNTEFKVYEVATPEAAELTLFLLIPAILLLITACIAANGRGPIPWLVLSVPMIAADMMLAIFPPMWYMCLYIGLALYFCVTKSFFAFSTRKCIVYRGVTALVLGVMLVIPSMIITQKTYDTKVREMPLRMRARHYLQSEFPKLFYSGNRAADSMGMSGGRLSETGVLNAAGELHLVVTLPKDSGTVHLRGAVYSDYAGNAWVNKDAHPFFFSDLREDFYDVTLADSVAKIGYKLINEYYSYLTTRFDLTWARMYVERVDADEHYVYTPYDSMTGRYDNDQPFTESFDYDNNGCFIVPARDNPDKYYFDYVYNPLKLPFYMAIERNRDLRPDMIYGYWDNEYARFMDKYTSFVYENYMEVPSECYFIRSLPVVRKNYGAKTFDVVAAVQDYLNGDFEYSMYPGPVPAGEDFIEYFLKENKKGFCMHFASAGVMLFRAMGIPARYVEGYVIQKKDYNGAKVVDTQMVQSLTAAGQEYEYKDMVSVNVMDSAAHAWVEIFIEGYGWYPVEVTKGFDMPESEEQKKLLKESGVQRPSVKTPTPKPSATPTPKGNTDPKKPTPTPLVSGTPTRAPKVTGKPGEGDLPNGDKPSGGFAKRLVVVLIVLGCIGSVVLAIYLRYATIVRLRERRYESGGRTSVLQVCKDVGRILTINGAVQKDSEFESAFVERVKETMGRAEDYEWLYQTGNRAAFGPDDISEGDRKRAVRFVNILRRETFSKAKLPKRFFLRFIRCI